MLQSYLDFRLILTFYLTKENYLCSIFKLYKIININCNTNQHVLYTSPKRPLASMILDNFSRLIYRPTQDGKHSKQAARVNLSFYMHFNIQSSE